MSVATSTRERLLHLAQAYAAARGLSLARVSTQAVNDGKVLPRLQAGRDIRLATYDTLVRWFAANWPEDVPWPQGVKRPRVGRAG